MDLWLQALLFGLFSALSLPVGAVLGIYLFPVKEKVTARWMAFGSGALVFAVATQLYGQALDRLLIVAARDLQEGKPCSATCRMHFYNIVIQNVTGILGAVMYLALNRCLVAVAARSSGGAALAATAPATELEASTATAASAAQSAENFAAGAGLVPAVAQQRLLRPSDRTATCPAPLTTPIAAMNAFRRAASTTATPAQQGSLVSAAAASDAEAPRTTGAAPSGHAAQPGEPHQQAHGDIDMSSGNVALSMWLGLLLDGIPESLMLGFMTNEGAITGTFLIAILFANFPEAFSGASLLRTQGMPPWKVFGMWFVVFALTGLLAMVGSIIMPDTVTRGSIEMKVRDTSTAALEGLTGGAMLAMIATAMLPEAFKGAGESAGLLFVLGFILSVWISCVGARFGGLQEGG